MESLRRFDNGGSNINWLDFLSSVKAQESTKAGHHLMVVLGHGGVQSLPGSGRPGTAGYKPPYTPRKFVAVEGARQLRPSSSMKRVWAGDYVGIESDYGERFKGAQAPPPPPQQQQQAQHARPSTPMRDAWRQGTPTNNNFNIAGTGGSLPAVARPGTGAGARPSSALSSRPGTSYYNRAEQQARDAHYDELWEAFRAADPADTEFLHVERVRVICGALGVPTSALDDVIDTLGVSARDTVSYADVITELIKRDLPLGDAAMVPLPASASQAALGLRLDKGEGARAAAWAGRRADLVELGQILHHPKFQAHAALRRALFAVSHGRPRLLRAKVFDETLRASTAFTTITRESLRRIIDRSDFNVEDDSIDIDSFILGLARAMRHLDASDADRVAAVGAAAATEKVQGAQRRVVLQSKLDRLRSYLRLADDRGLGKIRLDQFNQILALLGIPPQGQESSEMVKTYLDRFANKIDVARFTADLESGKLQLGGGGGGGGGGGSDREDVMSVTAGSISAASHATHRTHRPKFVGPAKRKGPVLFPLGVKEDPARSTPAAPGHFDDQDSINTPRMHPFSKTNPLLQDPVPVGATHRRLITLPSDFNPDYTYGHEHVKGAETVGEVLSHGYLRGHIAKRNKQLEDEAKRARAEAERFHTKATLARLEAAERVLAARQASAQSEPAQSPRLFKLSRFEKVPARTDSGVAGKN
jgi:Ca2+-binding EF-hand superfamily protein